MKILFATSEALPFCKTGGLADVLGILPRTLRSMGHDVRMVLPRYSTIDSARFRLLPMMPEMRVQYGPQTIVGSVLRCPFPGTDMPVYFIDEPRLFHREGLYGNGRVDYPDNDRRFAFFNMAVLWLLKGLDWQPDIIHLNDWQSGLVSVLLRHHPKVRHDAFFAPIRTVFSIHNLSYQGNFDKFLVPAIGLPWSVFTHDGMEFFGRASFLKAGLVYSDALVAVSPTYSREIQTEELGAGMDGTLRLQAGKLTGILNGIDTSEWDPARDEHIPANYTAKDLSGKQRCKAALLKEGGLSGGKDLPLVGMISRIISAKGFDLIVQRIERMLDLPARFYILGSGDAELEDALKTAAEEHPERIALRIGYEPALSHRIIAGADIFLMPSFYEPCGLTQLYSMRYGTIPVVHRTGGLSDTVRHATSESVRRGEGTGFLFGTYSAEDMLETLKGAIRMYDEEPELWKALQQNAMRQDFSWERSSAEYEKLYKSLTGFPRIEGPLPEIPGAQA